MLKINRHLVIVFIIISLLTGCVEDRTSSPKKPPRTEATSVQVDNASVYKIKNAAPIHFTVGEQEFEIVPVFTPILEYIQKVHENPKANYKELYISTVVEPFRKKAFGENNALWLKDQSSFAAPLSIERLNESIQLLDKNYDHFSHLIIESIKKSSNMLPGEKTIIYLFPFNPDQFTLIKQMSGVFASATYNQSNHIIVLQISPQNYKEEILEYTMAHEYHHTVYRIENKNHEKDLFDYVLTEGKADSFANMVFPDVNVPWVEELLPDEEQTIWNWAEERRYSFKNDEIAEMNAGYGGLPKWSDYRIGYQIMQEFLKKNPDIPLNVWTNMKPDEILNKSHFADRFR